MANIYDGAFRTILNDCRKMIIPVINEIFGETYTGEEEIRFFPNEHFLDQQDEADKERITDTNFTIFGKMPRKYHVECESSLPDGKITIRLFKYDTQIALDEGKVTEETLTVTFPNTAVLYLRAYKKKPDKMKYVIITPGGMVQYDSLQDFRPCEIANHIRRWRIVDFYKIFEYYCYQRRNFAISKGRTKKCLAYLKIYVRIIDEVRQ